MKWLVEAAIPSRKRHRSDIDGSSIPHDLDNATITLPPSEDFEGQRTSSI
jgi:hypothetical protein